MEATASRNKNRRCDDNGSFGHGENDIKSKIKKARVSENKESSGSSPLYLLDMLPDDCLRDILSSTAFIDLSVLRLTCKRMKAFVEKEMLGRTTTEVPKLLHQERISTWYNDNMAVNIMLRRGFSDKYSKRYVVFDSAMQRVNEYVRHHRETGTLDSYDEGKAKSLLYRLEPLDSYDVATTSYAYPQVPVVWWYHLSHAAEYVSLAAAKDVLFDLESRMTTTYLQGICSILFNAQPGSIKLTKMANGCTWGDVNRTAVVMVTTWDGEEYELEIKKTDRKAPWIR